MKRIGAVVIGRNEGERLRRSLASVIGQAAPIVYVDSGSTDDSIAMARGFGVEVVELDPALPFSIARARNEGVARLCELDRDAELVQFVDGDSEMVESWYAAAVAFFAADPRCAVLCGSLSERFPKRSFIQRMYRVGIDPRLAQPGIAHGIAMMRVDVFREMGGFIPWLVRGEDREMSIRLRRTGWRVCRIDAPMAVHESTMEGPWQWSRRRADCGRSLSQELAASRPPGRETLRAWLSTAFWGLALPIVAVAAAVPTRGASLLLFAGHAALTLRLYLRLRRLGFDADDAAAYAIQCTASKFPQGFGMARFHLERLVSLVRGAGPPPVRRSRQTRLDCK